ncbi:receptor-like protein 53 [Gossypium arboreum]|uniref:receptor-like protein 53 n=1 Tax=Gossypium arboreum TaxID=29729 RepID=UPI0022F1AF20|nr:receptor-like protein 53 [Gossypium arboreum]
MKLDMFVQLKNLKGLDLINVSLLIESNNRSLTFPQLETLSLRSCNLTEFPEFIKTQDKLVELDLSSNHIHGIVPNWLWKSSLSWVDLSFNVIDFPKQLLLNDANFSFPMLWQLCMGSCNISAFPEFLKSPENLGYLDLSNNKISGAIPNWVWKKKLYYLNLANNHLSSLDHFLPNQSLTSSQNSLARPICNLSQLRTFNVSHNNLSGPIPNCLGKMNALNLLDLQGNNFSGMLPKFSKATQLWFLKVSENRLEGKLPRTLAECTQLEVLDVGNNTINDTFPFWLEKLPYLTVLILRENRFYGQIKHFKHKFVFPNLDVLDIASNQFSGELSIDFLQATRLRSLKIGGNKLEGSAEIISQLHKDLREVAFLEGSRFMSKQILRHNFKNRHERGFPKLRYWTLVPIIFRDLSIEFLQSLKAMMHLTNDDKAKWFSMGEYRKRYKSEVTRVMNLSNNGFSGEISLALQNLKDLESLDLSRNQLSGKIPPQLSSLTFLEALNLSNNQLEESIPQSNQFMTFTK